MRPPAVAFVEVGPGRGTLMADALRAVARAAPEFRAAARVHLIETSPRLRAVQRERIGDAIWHAAIETVPDGPTIVLGNEFLDALPIRQFVRRGNGWTERFVGSECVFEASSNFESAIETDDGAIVERCEAAEAMSASLAARLVRHSGAALFLDYGPEVTTPGDSLQAIAGGRPADPFGPIGSADLTAHVDFARFRRDGEGSGSGGARPHPARIVPRATGIVSADQPTRAASRTQTGGGDDGGRAAAGRT